ncbi:MAG TPA: glycosyltransferase family 2 protein [Caulobacteraceae bacterium]|nr:glycosyltransferase family 2 protein [Caulobacteraceae bacterium]
MAAITVGVPVFNEAARLESCLTVLRDQTFTDFEVLIFDNASEDATGEVAQTFCATDPRFRYVRQPVNKGAMKNFADVLHAATSPYFLWRAADDRSDANYLEVLHDLLEADASKTLAVPRVLGSYRGEVLSTTRFPTLRGDGGLGDIRRQMFRCSPQCFYGLFRRAALVPILDRIWASYGDNGWASDFLLLLPFFMDGAVVGTDATTFEAALRPRRADPGQPRPPRTEADLDSLVALRRRFLDIAQTFVDERVPPGPGRMAWAVLLWLYADRRVYKTRHIVRRTARRLIGLRP